MSSSIKIIEAGMVEMKPEAGEEVAKYAMKEAQAGYAKTTAVGVTVQKGTSAKAYFDMRLHAVDSFRLAQSDAEFVQTLTQSERLEYSKKKAQFNGSLDIPWLKWLGANLNASVHKEDMDHSRTTQTSYSQKASAAASILSKFKNTKVKVQGELWATGISFTPTTAFAFIKMSQVKLVDGSILNVVSTHADDLEAASENGETVHSSQKNLNVLPA